MFKRTDLLFARRRPGRALAAWPGQAFWKTPGQFTAEFPGNRGNYFDFCQGLLKGRSVADDTTRACCISL
jgi:hypothetical protein